MSQTSDIRILAALLIAVVAACGCGSDGVESLVDRRAQSKKRGAVDSTHTSVISLVLHRDVGTTDIRSGCSGTLVAPRLVVTAWHCVDPNVGVDEPATSASEFTEVVDPTKISVALATKVTGNASAPTVPVADVYVPREDLPVPLFGHDIAMLELADPAPSDTAEPAEPRLDVAVSVGESLVAVGYGLDGERSDSEGVRRKVEHRRVTCLGSACDDRLAGAREFQTTDGVCPGDSGGAALDQRDRLVGVVSRGLPGCEDEVFSSVYAWREWIREKAREVAGRTDMPKPSWVDETVGTDVDGDGVARIADNCGDVANPAQTDSDRDGKGDACDEDPDGDGITGADNCPAVPNADQRDRDGDGRGNVCDADRDGDELDNEFDPCPNRRQADAGASDGGLLSTSCDAGEADVGDAGAVEPPSTDGGGCAASGSGGGFPGTGGWWVGLVALGLAGAQFSSSRKNTGWVAR